MCLIQIPFNELQEKFKTELGLNLHLQTQTETDFTCSLSPASSQLPGFSFLLAPTFASMNWETPVVLPISALDELIGLLGECFFPSRINWSTDMFNPIIFLKEDIF